MNAPAVAVESAAASSLSKPLRAALLTCLLWAALGLAAGVSLWWLKPGSSIALVFPLALAASLACATASFGLRLLRWHVLASSIAPDLPLLPSLRIGAIGFALAATPGKAGEALKLFLLRSRARTPVAASAPIILVEKATEGLGFLVLAALGALLVLDLDTVPWTAIWTPVLVLAAGALALVFRRPLAGAALRGWAATGLSVPGQGARTLANVVTGGDRVLAARPLAAATACSILARFFDAAALFWVAYSLGQELAPGAALLVLGSSGLVGGLSFLPAGVGAVETTQIALLVALGTDLSPAIAIAIATRILVLWLWVAVGLLLAAADGLRADAEP